MQKVSAQRQRITRALTGALAGLPEAARPLYVSVSGVDDLQPDARGEVDDGSPLRESPVGFAHIGLPVRRIIDSAGIASAFACLGTVCGPGKTFADVILPRIARGTWRVVDGGNNRVSLVHVEDAARALLHLAALPRAELEGRSFAVADGAAQTASEIFGYAAELLGAPAPGSVPRWLARWVAGKVAVETLGRDLRALPRALARTGFGFRYPDAREGLSATLAALGLEPGAGRKRPQRVWPLALLALAAIVYENASGGPLSIPWLARRAHGLPILDARLHYAPGDVWSLLSALGAGGRHSYLTLLWTVDLVLPALFALALSRAISRGPLARWKPLAWLAGCSDYAENIAISALLLGYPARREWLALLAALLTSVKFALYASAALAALATPLLARRDVRRAAAAGATPRRALAPGRERHP